MPELPEVETVMRGLNIAIAPPVQIKKIEVKRYDLRFPIPKSINIELKGQSIVGFKRRAKYLLWELETHVLVSHLGMTGTWRERGEEGVKLHDHVNIHLENGLVFVYRDPRRFGYLEFYKKSEGDYYRFQHLGPEPLGREFSVSYLKKQCVKRNIMVKKLIMDQKVVVGVGNIYACEALYSAKIHPAEVCSEIDDLRLKALVHEIKTTLRKAIKAGGSTISDFRQAGGDSGYFQNQFLVYGKEGQLCQQCYNVILNISISGRSSFHCPHCQKPKGSRLK